MAISSFLKSEAAPLASRWSVLVSLINLNVLNRVAQAHPLHARAASDTAMYHDDRQIIDQLFSITHVSISRQLHLKRTECE